MRLFTKYKSQSSSHSVHTTTTTIMLRKADGVKMDDSSDWKQVRKPWIAQILRVNRPGLILFSGGLFLGIVITGILFAVANPYAVPTGWLAGYISFVPAVKIY